MQSDAKFQALDAVIKRVKLDSRQRRKDHKGQGDADNNY